MAGNDEFAIAWCGGAMVDLAFTTSLVEVFRDPRTRQRCREHLAYQSGPMIAWARDALVRQFLKTDLPWLLFVDSDMVFTPDDVLAALQAGDAERAPIIGGDYTGYIPSNGYASPLISPPLTADSRPGLNEVEFVGTGFMISHRTVFETIAVARPESRLPWFEETVVDGYPTADDWTFCDRARASGFKVHEPAGIRLGHCKRVPIYP